ncbi:MAG: guanylate kinase [Oscillospiraceae bacterium]|nr:guanylate kinase [Oscillospiraceae bacterium]
MLKKKSIFVISGPSGSGKNTVYDGLRALMPEIAQTVSATTRAPREGEVDGVDYYFLSEKEFNDRVENGDFIEYVQYGKNYYGTLKSEIERLSSLGKIIVLIIEVNGALKFKELFPESVSLFIIPPSIEELKKRIIKRGQNTEADLQKRLQIAQYEMELKDRYDYCVVNNEIDDCINNVYNIIKGEQTK